LRRWAQITALKSNDNRNGHEFSAFLFQIFSAFICVICGYQLSLPLFAPFADLCGLGEKNRFPVSSHAAIRS
jgi:hypothetical protein